MNTYYEINIAGLKRSLPLCKINDDLFIGAFIMFGDVEITKACATELLKKAPEFDIMITAESKGLPLLYEMARQINAENYILARKVPKLYMKDIITTDVNSITTEGEQKLYLDTAEAEELKGKRVIIADDVISLGESLKAVQTLLEKAGANVVANMTILAEGDAANRKDIIYLEKLPLFKNDGTILE